MFISKSIIHYLFLIAFFTKFTHYQKKTQTTSNKTNYHNNLFIIITIKIFINFSFLLYHPTKFQFPKSPQLITNLYIKNILNNKIFLNQTFKLNLYISRIHFKTQNTPPNFNLIFNLPNYNF